MNIKLFIKFVKKILPDIRSEAKTQTFRITNS